MRFELTHDFLDILRQKVAEQDTSWIQEHVLELHYADIAEIIDKLNNDEAKFIYFLVEEELQADILMELDEDVRDRFLSSLSTKEIADQLENLDSDEAAEDIVDLLNYDEDTAGGLMQKEFFQAEVNWTVTRALVELRKQAEDVEKVYNIFVVNETNHLLGVLSLKRLLFANTKTKIVNLYQSKNIISVKTSDSAEEVAKVMEKWWDGLHSMTLLIISKRRPIKTSSLRQVFQTLSNPMRVFGEFLLLDCHG
jgi:magnesium transporter